MVAVTYSVARVPAAAEKASAARATWFVRFMNALMESRERQARRELAKHAHLLPYSLDERGDRLVKTGAKEMPFGG